MVLVLVMMRQLIVKYGQVKIVIVITLMSIILSVVFSFGINYLIAGDMRDEMIYTAIIVPLLVAPLVSFPLVKLLVKVDGLEKEMRALATFDFLTGLLSRQAFFHDVTSYIILAERDQQSFSVLAIDLDKFKQINDSYGHPAGDEVLKDFARTAQTVLRKSDLIGRIGGEEFAIMLLNNTAENKASEIAQRLHIVINNSVVIYEGLLIKYTVSMGLVSSLPDKTVRIEEILKQADQALYQAKKNGRNQTAIFRENEIFTKT